MSHKYILHGHTPIICDDLDRWARWFETADRVVEQDHLHGEIFVSTVFLGLDHRFVSDGPPLLFETMIFGGKHDLYQQRYTTWDEALEGHKQALLLAMEVSHADL